MQLFFSEVEVQILALFPANIHGYTKYTLKS